MTDNSAYNRIYETANEGGIYATPASYNVPIPSNATVGGAPLSPQFVDALANYLNSQSQQQPPTQDPATAVAPTAGAVTAPPSAPQADSMASPSETAQPQPPQSQEDSAVDPMLANILSGNAPQQPKVNAPAVEGADQSLVNAISGIPNPQQPSEPPDRNDFRYRMAFGMQDPLAGIGQAAAHIIPSAIEPAGYAKSIDQQINQREAEYQKAHNVEGIDFARIAGNIISPANALLPLRAIAAIPEGGSALMRIAKSALAGGAMAAAQPTDVSGEVSYGGAKGLQTVAGAATGAALSAAGEGLARMINPKVSADAQTLLDEGIRVPTDQIGGGGGS
ncbi:MAG: hypothetical protein KGJ90_07275, partial [Patescibacteria group bacterium]|nr:hypothetical protein [Patescibacteria group bacterium]